MLAELEGDRIYLAAEFRDSDLVKAVPGTVRRQGRWSLPVSWANCLCLRGVFGERLELGPLLKAWGEREVATRVEPALLARERAMDPGLDDSGDSRLYPYQRTGVAFMRAAGSAIIGDEMGLGKTFMSLAAAEEMDQWPVLIVCPNTLKTNWREEIEQWYPHRTVQVIDGGVVTRRKQLATEADVYIINWDALRFHSRLAGYGSIALTDKEKTPGELNRQWGMVIVDEAHRAKDPKAKQTRALWAIGDTAKHRFALTGTPASESPSDFWTLLRFVSPDEWPAKSKFIDRYCITAWNGWGGIDVIGIRPELREEYNRVVQPRFLRRLKAMCLPYLPDKVPVTRLVEMSAAQKKNYKQMVKDQIAELDGGTLIQFDGLSLHTRLAQFSSANMYLDEKGDPKLCEPSCKVDEMMLLLEELGDEPVVIFAQSAQLLRLAEQRLAKAEISHGAIAGYVDGETRDWAKRAFMDGRIRVLLLTYGAGAEGLTLTRAKTMIMLQRAYSLIKWKQALDRIHRPGAEAHDSLQIITLVAKDTVEEKFEAKMDGKEAMMEQVTGDREELLKWMRSVA